jgi:hypothetical protein
MDKTGVPHTASTHSPTPMRMTKMNMMTTTASPLFHPVSQRQPAPTQLTNTKEESHIFPPPSITQFEYKREREEMVNNIERW